MTRPYAVQLARSRFPPPVVQGSVAVLRRAPTFDLRFPWGVNLTEGHLFAQATLRGRISSS
jgi:hypothetical protein